MSANAVNSLYTVAIGDSLSKIAQRFYGDARQYPLIAERNSIQPTAILMIGQRLIIPPMPSVQSAVEEVQVTNAAYVPVPGSAPTGNLPVAQGIETITTTASVWYKDWRYWVAIGGVAAVLWMMNSRRR